MTLHYRQVVPETSGQLLDRTWLVLAPHEQAIRVRTGPRALEITAAPQWHKGSAIRFILEQLAPSTVPLYAGDQANDLEAFALVESLGGISIGVGCWVAGQTQYHLPDPEALIEFLTELALELPMGNTQ